MGNLIRTTLIETNKQLRMLLKSKAIFVLMTLYPILEFCLLYGRYIPFKTTSRIIEVNSSSVDYFSFFLIGYIGLMLFQSVILAGWLFSKERIMGTLELIYLTPANRLGLLMGNAFVGIIQNSWMSLIFSLLIINFIPNGISLSVYTFLLVIPLYIIPAIAWGTFTNSLMLFSRNSNALVSLLERPLGLLSGVEIPINVLPNCIQSLSYIIPLSYSINVIRKITLTQVSIKEIIAEIFLSFIISILFVFISWLLSIKAEKYLKKTGSITFF